MRRTGGSFEGADRFDEDLSLPSFSTGTLDQLPRVTSKATIYKVYSFLLSAAIAATMTQTLSLLPPGKPIAEKMPFISLGIGMIGLGINRTKGKNTPGVAQAFFGMLLGSVVGL